MDTQGKILSAAAVSAGAALLLSRQMRSMQPSGAMWAADRAMAAQRMLQDQVRSRPVSFGTLAAVVIGGLFLASQIRKERAAGTMRSIEERIEVDVPLSTAYNQWTQFEEFPRFMSTVQEVHQLDDTHLHWRANVAGRNKEWDAEITEQIPDQRIAWRSTNGPNNSGVVTFNKLADNKTEIRLHMDYEPETVTERVGDVVGGVKLTAKGNLRRFKDLIEGRGVETGAWRGTATQH